MSEIYFKSILISDINKNVAKYQEFEKGFNVVTSSNNHVGKSSLLKSLYYTLGAEVEFDTIWDKNSKLYSVTISVDNEDYTIARLQKRFAVFKAKQLVLLTQSVTKELARMLSDIFKFCIFLPNKTTKMIELAPPAFTFMPYYIDQDEGWSGLYNSFSNIEQYKKPDRIKSLYYHLGIYNKQTVELSFEKDSIKDEIDLLNDEDNRLNIILSGLSTEIQNLLPAETMQELEQNLEIPKNEISNIVKELGFLRNKMQSLESILQKHKYQLNVVSEYKTIKDDISTTTIDDVHKCPNCGYSFDNEILSIVRNNYHIENEDYLQQQIQLLIESIDNEYTDYKNKYVALMNVLADKERVFNDTQNEYNLYVKQRGLRDSIESFTSQKDLNLIEINDLNDRFKKINKELSKLPNKKEIEDKYIELVRLNIMSLGAWNVAYENNIKLLKPIKAQGTLESKIILAQITAMFQTINYFETNTITLPFVVDSPRAKEASQISSEDIIKLISEINMLPQVILATIDYDNYSDKITADENIITLSEKNKLLNEECFKEHKEYIQEILQLMKSI